MRRYALRKFLVALVAFSAVLLASTDASALVSAEVRYWLTEIDADAKVTEAGIVGTDINLVDDLGVDDQENFWDGRIALDFGRHKIRYGYMPLDWSGSKTITEEITFGGETFSASALVDSSLDIDYHRLGYQYDFIEVKDSTVGLIIEAKYFSIDANLNAAALAIDETESIEAPLPTVGLAAELSLPALFSVEGELTGVTLGSDRYFIDGEAAVNFKPIPFVAVAAGYRYLKLHIEEEDDEGELMLKGPFVMVRGRF